MSDVQLSSKQLALLFPAYLRTTHDLTLTEVGPSILRLTSADPVPTPLTDLFVFERPLGEVAPLLWADQGRGLQMRLNGTDLCLRGVVLREATGLLFCLSHAATHPLRLTELGLRMTDFSPADGAMAMALTAAVQEELVIETRGLITEVGQARDAALAASRAKSAFLANMSHEIRTPLNGVTGIIGALARTKLTPPQREMVALVEASGKTLERLLGDILDLAKVEAGHLSITTEAFDLRTLVEDAVQLMRVRADDKGVAFHTIYGPGAQGAFVGDTVRIKQILANLTSNAIKFTEAGKVQVFVDVTPAEQSNNAFELTLQVLDTGIGFDPDQAEGLFSRFDQLDPKITQQFGGAGLGLSICKSLCTLMGGTIEASSTPGVGSAFVVNLPVTCAEPQPPKAQPRPRLVPDDVPMEEIPRLRVLLVEDHPTNQTVVRLILEPLQVDLAIASDGLEGIELFRSRAFDLVLMDMRTVSYTHLTLPTNREV